MPQVVRAGQRLNRQGPGAGDEEAMALAAASQSFSSAAFPEIDLYLHAGTMKKAGTPSGVPAIRKKT